MGRTSIAELKQEHTRTMSLEHAVRDLVSTELNRLLTPLTTQLMHQKTIIDRLASAFGGAGLTKMSMRGTKTLGPIKVRATRAVSSDGSRACAVMGCKNDARSKGYCAKHYQKYRNLMKTNRLPSDWVEGAEPQSVQNITLPRGRAGAKALAEVKKSKRGSN